MQGSVDHITVRGFLSLARVERLALRPINVLIGANGSGKSNLIQAFSLLRDIEQGHLGEYTKRSGGADSVLHFGAKTTEQVDLEISFAEGVNGYRVSLIPSESDELSPIHEQAWFWDKGKHEEPHVESLRSRGLEAGISGCVERTGAWVKRWMSSFRVYHFDDTGPTSPMKKTADLADNRFFRADGSNLASYLYFLMRKHPESYQLIVSTVKQVTPFFGKFELSPSRLNEEKIRLEWSHTSSDKYFNASAFSDGTLRFICLATLFLQPVGLRPSLILVDEPELGLHPYAIAMLASLIRRASLRTRILVSTQSPLFLDQFEPKDVLVASRSEGASSFERLGEESFAEWLDEYSLGQLWEKNQLGGRPGRE